MKIEIVSRINADGYIINDKFYYCNEIDKIKNLIGDEPVSFVKGRNTFAGEEVSDEFFYSMIERLGY